MAVCIIVGLIAAINVGAIVCLVEADGKWLFAAALAAAYIIFIVAYVFWKRRKGEPIPPVDVTFGMTGREFEAYVALVYTRLGYKVSETPASHDQGIDLVVKRFIRTGIQVKCFSGTVNNHAVQEAAAGKKYYRLMKVCVVTNSIFTAGAKRLAAKNRVRLIDRTALAELVRRANAKYAKKHK